MRKDRCLSPTRPEIKEINNSISKELGLENQSIYTKDLVEKIQLFASLNSLDLLEAIKPKYRKLLLDYLRKAYKINTFYETHLYLEAQLFIDTIEGLGEPIEASEESVRSIKQMLDEATENHATYFKLNDGSYIISIDKPVEKVYGVNNELELQQIKSKAIADGTFMKAPNGKPTNLTERQWLQVRTKAFKDWFGDWINDSANASKVVDENGEPLVVYHTTHPRNDPSFTIFDIYKEGKRSFIYTTDSFKMSESYAPNESRNKSTGEVVKKWNKEKAEKQINKDNKSIQDLKEFIERYNKANNWKEYFNDESIDEADFEDFSKQRVWGIKEAKNGIKNLEAEIDFLYDLLAHPEKMKYTKALFVNIKNPFIVNAEGNWWNELNIHSGTEGVKQAKYMDSKKRYKEEVTHKYIIQHYGQDVFDAIFEYDTDDIDNYLTEEDYKKIDEVVNKKYPEDYTFNSTRTIESSIMEDNSYDGMIVKDVKDYGPGAIYVGDNGDVFAAKEPNQIKSATDNNGEFSDEDNNIYHEHFEKNKSLKEFRDKQLESIFANNYDKNNLQIDVLSAIKDRMLNTRYSKIFKYLEEKGLLKDLNISLENGLTSGIGVRKDLRYQGRRAYYEAETNTIHINALADFVREGVADAIIMHEILHSITVARIQSNKEFRTLILNVIDKYNKESSEDSYKYTGDHAIEEFVADLWSSPELAKDLISIPATEEKTLLDRVKEILNKIFNNLFKGNLTLFEEASGLVLNLLDENVSTNGKGIFYEQITKSKQLNVLQTNFVRSEAERDTQSLYVFTDNTDRTSGRLPILDDSPYAKKYGKGLKYPTLTQAVLRGLPNAMPISTQRWIFDHGRGKSSRSNPSPGQWRDEDLKEFKKVITQEINDIIAEWNTGKYTTLKIGTGDAIFNGAISEITQERTPKLYKFLQSEWNRLLSAVNKTSLQLIQNQALEVVKDLDYYTKQLLQLREDFTKVVRKRKDFKTSHVYEVLVDGEWRDADMSVTLLIEGREAKTDSGQSRYTIFGNTNDAFIRDYFAGKLEDFYPNIGDKNSRIYQQLNLFCKDFNDVLKAKFEALERDYKVFTKFDLVDGNDEFTICQKMRVSGEFKYVAGTIDMIVVDSKGNYYLYDMKTTGKDYSTWKKNMLPKYNQQVGVYRQMLLSNARIEIKDKNVGFLVTRVAWPKGESNYNLKGDSIYYDGLELYENPEFNVGRWDRLDSSGYFIVLANGLMTGTPDSRYVLSALLSLDQKDTLTDMPLGEVYKTEVLSTVKQTSKKDIENVQLEEEEDEQFDFDTSDLFTETVNSVTQPVSAKEQLFVGRTAIKVILDKIDEISANNSSLDDLEIEGIVPNIEGLSSQLILRRCFNDLLKSLYKWFRDNYLLVFEEDSDEVKYKKEFLSDERNFSAIMNSVQADFAEATGLPLKSNLRVLVENEENPDVDDMFEQDRLAEDGREPYSIDSKEKSYEKTMTQEVKKEFSRIVLYKYQKDENGAYILDELGYPITEKVETINQYDEVSTEDDYEEDPYGYGFPLYIDKHKAINFIFERFHTCQDSEELKQAMKNETKNTPWLSVIVRKMEDNPEFATLMFVSFNRNKSLYMEGKVAPEDRSFNKKLKAWLVDRWTLAPLNEKVKLDELRAGINEKFLGEQDISEAITREGKDGKYRFVYNHTKANKEYQKLKDTYNNTDTYNVKVNTLKAALALFGFDVSRIEYPENLIDSHTEKLLWGGFDSEGLFVGLMGALNDHSNNVTYEAIAKEYSAIARIVTKGMADRYELSSYSGGKSYMTYTQISHIERLIAKLSGENPLYTNEVLFSEDSMYTKYRSYYVGRNRNGEMIFTNSVLLEIYNDWQENIESQEAGESFFEKRKYLKHYTLTAMDSKQFFKQSQADVWYSILTAYFAPMMEGEDSTFYYEDGKDIGKDLALFRVGTMSDKPASEFIQWFKPARVATSGNAEEALSEFKEAIADKAYMYFAYEIERMKAVLDQLKNSSATDIAAFNLDRGKAKSILAKVKKGEKIKISDLVDPNTKQLYGFIKKSGLSFRFLPMFNLELELNTSFGKTIISLLYNSKELDYLSDFEKNNIYELFRDLYIEGMDEQYRDFKALLSEDLGVEESKLLKTIQKSLPITSNDDRLLLEFFYNDSLMTMNLYNLLMGDIAYKKDTIDLLKRSAEYHATTTKADIKAKMREGMPNNSKGLYSDGKFRAIIIEDQKDYNKGLAKEVKKIFQALELQARDAGDGKKANMYHTYSISIPSMIEDGIEVTDGLGFSSPTAFWKKMHMLGECPIEFDNALLDIKAGSVTSNNIDVVIQEFKPFVFTQIEKAGTKDFGKQLVPMQIKDSEAMIMLAGAIIIGAEKAGIIENNPIVELFKLMEASAYGLTLEYIDGNFDISHCTMDKYTGKGIDTIVFKSAVKNGASGVLNLNGKNNELIRTEVFNKVLDKNGKYNPIYVQEFDFRDWGKQQNNPAHMLDNESGIGSQIRILSVSDLPENFQLPKSMLEMRKWGIYKGLSDKQIFLKHYFELLDEDFRRGIEDVKQLLGLNGDEKVTDKATGKQRWISSDEKLALLVLDAIARDTKYSYELYKAFTLVEELKEGLPIKRFAYSIGDPSVSDKAFSVIFSLIKKRVNNEVLPGGPVVQVAPYGMSEELHLINNEGEIIDVDTLVKGGKIVSGMTMEVYITAPTREIQRAIMYNSKKMGRKKLSRKYAEGEILDIEDIKALGILTDKDLEMIGYRIPTEDKYSAYRMKIKGFLPREAGELIIMPKEITLLSGTDYDIDKMYCMFRYSTDTAMKLREKQEEARADRMTIKNEIFDMMWEALGDPSCIEKLLHPGSFKPLVDIAKELDDHYKEGNESLMYVLTQVKLHKANAAGKEFVGIAALNNVSHSVTAFANIHFREPVENEDGGFDFNFTIEDSKGNVITNRTFVDETGKVRIDPEYSPVDGERLSRTIGMFVGASADNAKEAVLGSININPTTGTIAMGMMRIGFSPRTIAYMLSMPSALRAMKMSQVYGIRFERALGLVYNEVTENTDSEKASKILQESTIRELDMLDVIKGRTTDDDLDLAVLTFLLNISDYCKAISDINSLTSLNSTKNAVGPTAYDTIETEYKIKQFLLETEDSLFDTDILLLAKQVPFLKTLANVYTEVDGNPGLCELACRFSLLYQINFRKVLDKLSEKNVRLNADFIKKLYNAFCVFEMTRTREGYEYPIMEADLQSRILRLYGFPVLFLKAKQGYLKDNIVTLGMYVDAMNRKNRIQAVRLSEGLSRENRDDMSADWESILTSNEGRAFSSKLIEYMVSRFGFSWMPRSAMSVTPNRAKMNIFGYSDLFTQKDRWLEETVDNFIAQFALNNTKERSFWMKVNKKSKKNKNEDVEDSGIKEKEIQLATYPKSTKVKAIEFSNSIYESNFKQYFGILYDGSPYIFYEKRGDDIVYIKANELGIANNFLEYNADENAAFMESAKDYELTEQLLLTIENLNYDNNELEDEESSSDDTGEVDEEELMNSVNYDLYGDDWDDTLLKALEDEYQNEKDRKLKRVFSDLRKTRNINRETLNTVKGCLSKIDEIIKDKPAYTSSNQRKELHQKVLDLLLKLNIC